MNDSLDLTAQDGIHLSLLLDFRGLPPGAYRLIVNATAQNQLLPGVVFQRFSVGRQDLEVVEPGVHSRVTPDDFLLSGDLE